MNVANTDVANTDVANTDVAGLEEVHAFLGCETPPEWVAEALNQLPILLLDHKNCEWKAASTDFHLMGRHGTKVAVVTKLSRLAREELVHMEQVLRLMRQRGMPVTKLSASRYASRLRDAARTHEPGLLVDTLIVGAFIEARSCERFAALAPHLDDELKYFYMGLLRSETRHFMDYLKLAHVYAVGFEVGHVAERVAYFREIEKDLIESPDSQFRFHSGMPKISTSKKFPLI